MAKFLFLSGTGDGLGLALRLHQAGHNVAVNIHDKRSRLNYDGLLVKLPNYENFLDKSTIVVFDSSGGGKTADRLKSRGHHVFAGSTFADQLEVDRMTALEFLKRAGVKVPKTEVFYDWESGKRYAKQRGKRLVFKSTGTLGGDPSVGSYSASDPQDMVEMIEYFESISTHEPEFILQDFVEGGVAVSTEGWFNGKAFMHPFNHTLERKQLMDDDLGPSGGCAGNVVWKAQVENNIIKEGIAKMAPLLQEFEYVGPIDLNTIVTEEGVWALEFTPRFGYDALPALLQLYEGDVGTLIAQMAMGENPEEVPLKEGFGAALRVSVPPYPSEEFKHQGGIPIRGFSKEDRDNLFLYDVMLDGRDKLVTTPAYGTVGALTGYGREIFEAFAKPYELAEKAKVPEKQYRTDLVKVMSSDHARWVRLVEYAHTNVSPPSPATPAQTVG